MRANDYACSHGLGCKALTEMFKLIQPAAKGITALLQMNGHERLHFCFSKSGRDFQLSGSFLKRKGCLLIVQAGNSSSKLTELLL